MYCNECMVVARAVKSHPDDDHVVTVRPNEERFIFSVEVRSTGFVCVEDAGCPCRRSLDWAYIYPCLHPTTKCNQTARPQTTGALTAEQVVETALEILLDKVNRLLST